MTTVTIEKPAYLGLLNAISLGESNAGKYLTAWANVTPDPQLKKALCLVAGRETSHGVVFCQLIERLGFSLREREDPTLAEKLRVYGDPACSDAEKIRFGRRDREESDDSANDFLASIDAKVNDESVDSLTRDTLRWYVHEERDSGELLRAEYARVEAMASGRGMNGSSNGHAMGVSADARAIMDCMTQGFASLQQSMKELSDALAKRSREK